MSAAPLTSMDDQLYHGKNLARELCALAKAVELALHVEKLLSLAAEKKMATYRHSGFV